MKRTILLIVTIIFSLAAQNRGPQAMHEEDRELYDKFFDQAAAEFGVPSDILRGLSFSETRWTHMKWNDGDTSSICNGMPRVYGVMGLWDNDVFGHSLREAATLIGKNPQELKDSPLQNIRGSAALIKKYYAELPLPEGIEEGSIESWQTAVAAFSGFPQPEIAAKRGLEVYTILSTGYDRDRMIIQKRAINLEPIQNIVNTLERRSLNELKKIQPDNAMNTPDYPLAKWNVASPENYGTTLIQQKFVVIHDVEGSYLGCISWFKQVHLPPSGPTSAHYVLNSHPNGVNSSTKGPNTTPDAPVGEVTQMVEEKYRAYHVGCWNSYMIGIEHEGYAGVSGWYTVECYNSSSMLVKYLCDKYNIPKDRNHIIAHSEHQNVTWRNWVTSSGQGFDPTCNTHTDPGPFWAWTSYMALVATADTIRPVVVNALPQSNVDAFPAYKGITIEFNTPMDIASTNAAFSINPNVAGTKNWNQNNTILIFDPSAYLPWNTHVTVTIDTSAKNVAQSRNLGITPYVKTFTTVPLDTVGPDVISSYPVNGESGVSLFTDVVLRLNEPVQTSSLSTTLKMVDENNASVTMASAKNEVVMDKGIISFTPTNLKPNKTYTIKLLAGMKDTYGNVTKAERLFQFTTTPDVVTAGTPIDNLDANTKGWQQPYQSDRSRLYDSSATAFTFGSEKIKAGSGAAKLSYVFSSADSGVIEVKANGYPPVDFYTRIGLWISGDASNNFLELHSAPNDQVLNIGKIFWYGWKFIEFPISSITGANKIVKSLVVRQESGALREGKLLFDEVQVDATITGLHNITSTIPAQYTLGQNYPNPFNPNTTITFTLPMTGHVSLKVYDVLGREVAVLSDQMMQSGTYEQVFDASSLTTGVYYYVIHSGSFVETRSMILLK
ncbi:MAG: Ig-like domain-containing protein [Bacteroidetes bacterium]|nr:Ig-like domain-containing protein [Bacteroidota bacterium]